MGITDLNKIIKKYSADAITENILSHYKYKILTIDISIFLYQYKYKFRYTNFINGILKQVINLLKNNITPVYIFDGKPPKEKNSTLENRTKVKNKCKDRICKLEQSLQNANTIQEKNDINNEIKKIKKNVISVKNKDKRLCMKIFDLLGIPYITAEGEAEILCARLCKLGYADGCISQDSDILPNGSNVMIKDYRLEHNVIQEINYNKILNNLEISESQFIDLCILCGCDYVGRIKGIGPINALKLIKKHKNIETILLNINHNKYKIPDNYVEKYTRARTIFTHVNNDDIEKSKKNMKLNTCNINEFMKIIETCENIDKYIVNDITKNIQIYIQNINSILHPPKDITFFFNKKNDAN